MFKFLAILAISIFPATAALAEWDLFPAFYDVTGVASDDVLNVRVGTGAAHPIIETLAYNDRYVEIVELSADGKWGLIGYPGGSGWASMRYLERQSGQNGSELPRPLSCGGNEPFWGLHFSLRGNDFSEPGQPVHILPSVWEGIPDGMLPVTYGIRMAQGGDKIDAVINRNRCSDGMSENEYGFEINALLSGSIGNRMLTGCCSLGRP
jgi:uncharacterized membrane protein